MSQKPRALVAFLVAPAVPGTLLYIYQRSKGYGDAAIPGPVILTLLGYVAAIVIGIPVYSVMQRKGICSLRAYILVGAVIGPLFSLMFEILTTYPGTVMARLENGGLAMLVTALYSAVAAGAFWLIAFTRTQTPKQES
jgi:hypothetical protein